MLQCLLDKMTNLKIEYHKMNYNSTCIHINFNMFWTGHRRGGVLYNKLTRSILKCFNIKMTNLKNKNMIR